MNPRIRYACPHCNRRIVHHPELAGQLVICSECKGEFYEPTDPLPGKPAQQALKPRAPGPRRLRVPEGSNPKHDLAILAPRDGSDLRTIEEIVEAVLLDGNDPPPSEAPAYQVPEAAKPAPNPLAAKAREIVGPLKPKVENPAPLAVPAPRSPAAKAPPLMPFPGTPTAIPARPSPPRKQDAIDAEIDFMPTASPAAPLTAVPSLGGPAARRPNVPLANRPIPVMPAPLAQPAVPQPGVPSASLAAAKTAAPTLAGVSLKQIADELRRRGLGVAMLTCEMGPMRNFELTFSENMTREDAIMMLQKYVQAFQEPAAKPTPGRMNPLKRLWGSSEEK